MEAPLVAWQVKSQHEPVRIAHWLAGQVNGWHIAAAIAAPRLALHPAAQLPLLLTAGREEEGAEAGAH